VVAQAAGCAYVRDQVIELWPLLCLTCAARILLLSAWPVKYDMLLHGAVAGADARGICVT